MNDEYEKYKRGKVYQAFNWVGTICLFVLMAYWLFEAYWTEEVLDWGRGASFRWISYQSSPNKFVEIVVFDVIFFLLACVPIAISVWRKITEK